MAWLYLILAGISEVGWPLGFKLAQTSRFNFIWVLFSVLAMSLSGCLLYMAQREIPIGTAYVVWTSIGAIGTFAIGVVFFADPLTLWRTFAIMLILSGVIILKFAH